jgi:hypothetical protein
MASPLELGAQDGQPPSSQPNYAQACYPQGYPQGYAQGYPQGYAQGYPQNYPQGYGQPPPPYAQPPGYDPKYKQEGAGAVQSTPEPESDGGSDSGFRCAWRASLCLLLLFVVSFVVPPIGFALWYYTEATCLRCLYGLMALVGLSSWIGGGFGMA